MSGRRPVAKLKVMAKLGENLYGTTKIYRMLQERQDLRKPDKLKWQDFVTNTQEEHAAWRAWWHSSQSNRWKNLQPVGWRSSGNNKEEE